jgi:DinB superfamily
MENRTASDQSATSRLDRTNFATRLDDVEKRLDARVAAAAPTGLTEPDPGGTERWEAGQVWSHMAEFVPYWKGQVESIIGAFDGAPVPFGRLKDDPGRLSGIEMGRHEAIGQMGAQVHDSIEELKAYLGGLTSAEWNAVGLHAVRGEMDVESIVGRFVVSHLEEHADQLDLLASS